MKKALCFLCVLAILLPTACQKKEVAEAIPEAARGYGKVSWGATEAEVRAAYNIGEDITAEINKDDPNLTSLRQDSVSEVISRRRFDFNQGKLYGVYILYSSKNVNRVDLQETLNEKYGPYWYDITDMEFGQRCYTTYLPRHSVVFSKNYDGSIPRVNLSVYYRWAEFDNAYKFSRIEPVEL